MSCVLPACRSSFSLLYGTTPPETLLARADDYGYKTLFLADINNLYGCYDFYYEALRLGIKPIIGAELDTEIGNIILLCENHDGFKNLSRLITEFQLNGAMTFEKLVSLRENQICLASYKQSLDKLKPVFGENLYCRIGYDKPSLAYRLANEKGIKPAAIPEVSFLEREDFARHRLLRAIEGGYLVENLPGGKTAGREEYLRECEWYNCFYAPYPDAIRNGSEISERCRIQFPQKKNILPDITVAGDHFNKLQSDALRGLTRKNKNIPARYAARLEYELSVIRRTGFTDYFLIVDQILNFCRENGITVVGRGSAAGSLVSYALGITRVDPIEEGLYFERFLNEARTDCPDIDLDIDWRRRDDVLDFIYDKYGHEHVAMMATYIRFQPRLAIRECAKAFGFNPDEINRFVKRLPWNPMGGLDGNIAQIPKATRAKLDWKRFEPVLKAARSISGLPRHLSIHSGGIVITPEPITNYVPLERATKGIAVTQCDMYQAEKIGLVKIDILGQRGLAVIADCLETVKKTEGDDFEVPENDPDTYRMLQSGKTIGVFQIESPGLRALLRDLQPKVLNDITLALALIRPGASESGMKRVFLNRFHGKEETMYPHPCLEDTLKETHGVFIYQEQVLLAARKIAGFNLPASDLLRRAITKKRKVEDKSKLETRFLEGARKNQIDGRTTDEIFAHLKQFAAFGFCKAHAATYGHLAYLSAYFKTHHPGLFMTAVLRNGGGYYPSAVYVAEARRLGVTILPPDVHYSERHDNFRNGRIYLGLARIMDMAHRTLEQIETQRPFESLADFLSRVDISEREIENLIRVGFFDSLDTSRPKLLWQYRLWGRRTKKISGDLFGGRILPPAGERLPRLEPFSRLDIFRAEKNILSIPASFHPLALFEGYRDFSSSQLREFKDQAPIQVSGWLADRKRIKTRDNKHMVFLTFDAVDDTFEVILFPDTYNKYSETIRTYRYLAVDGYVNYDDGSPAIVAEHIKPAKTGLRGARFI